MDNIEELETEIAEDTAPKPKKKKQKPDEKEPENIENTKINFKNGITVYEGKMTFLIAGAILTLLFALSMYFFRLDISANLTTVVTTFILAIAGITTAEQAINMVKGNGILGNRGEHK